MCRKRDVWMLLNNHFADLGIPKHVHDADMWPRRYIAKPALSVAALETIVRLSSHNYVTFALDLFRYFP